MEKMRLYLLVVASVSVLAPRALADGCDPTTDPNCDPILSIQNTNGSQTVNLSQILNGSYVIADIINGNPSAGSINVINNTGTALTSLTLYYNGVTGTAAGDQLSCQSNGNFSPTTNTPCYVYDPNNNTKYFNGNSTPNDLPYDNYAFVWTFSSADQTNYVAAGDEFNIAWASFSHMNPGDTGCIGGTTSSTCGSATVPDGGVSLMMLSGALIGLETLRRRFRA